MPRHSRRRVSSDEAGVTVDELLGRQPRRRRPPPLVTAAAALVILAVAVTLAVLRPWNATAELTLSTSRVAVGDSYSATASGFAPGEDVRISWVGPTDGVMNVFPAGPDGTVVHGPIIERDPPGDYRIIATGLSSRRSADAPLTVIPGDASTGATP